jgi:hypothetical protein
MTSEGMDRDLVWTERLAVRAHFLICNECRNFAQQVQALRAFARALVDHVCPAADRPDE